MQESNEEITKRLKQIAENFSKNPMDPVMRTIFGEVKKQLILSMIETGVVLGMQKGRVMLEKMQSGESPPSIENLKLISEATAKEVYSMKESDLDIIFTI